MKRLLIILASAAALLIVLVVARALVVQKAGYLQILPPPIELGIDLEQAAKNLGGAIRIETISSQRRTMDDPQAFRAFQQYLADTYPVLHANLDRQRINEYSLLYHWRGADPGLEPILMLAHYDTVPVTPGSEDRWSYPPFSGAVEEGFIWGRGTLDDKGTIIAQMETIEQLLSEGYQPQRSIYLAYGHDEEIGGQQGAKKISEYLQAAGETFSLVLDEGSAIGASGMIPGVEHAVALLGHAEKGYLSLRLTAEDSGGHSSMPPRHTAAGQIAAAVMRLENTQMPASLDYSNEFFDSMMAFLPFGQRLFLANRWLFETLLLAQMEQKAELNATLRTTTAVTMLSGSPKENVLPTEASAVINFRIMPGETVQDVTDHVRRMIKDDAIRIEPTGEGLEPSPVSPIDGPAYALLERTARESWPDDTLLVAPRLVLATTDTRHYHDLSGQIFRFMPVSLEFSDVRGIHGSNERLSLDNLENMLRFYRQLIINADSEDSL